MMQECCNKHTCRSGASPRFAPGAALLQRLFFVITLTGLYCRSGASPRFTPGATLLRWLFHVVVLAWFYKKTVAAVQESAQ